MGLSHVIQNSLVEEKEDLISSSQGVWDALVAASSPSSLAAALRERGPSWLALAVAAPGTPLPPTSLVVAHAEVGWCSLSACSRMPRAITKQL